MTKRKLVSLLIKDYQWTIEEVNKLTYVKEIKKFLEREKLNIGIYCTTKKDILQSLETRLEILKSIYK